MFLYSLDMAGTGRRSLEFHGIGHMDTVETGTFWSLSASQLSIIWSLFTRLILLESYCIKNVYVSMYVQSTLSKMEIFRTSTFVCPGESSIKGIKKGLVLSRFFDLQSCPSCRGVRQERVNCTISTSFSFYPCCWVCRCRLRKWSYSCCNCVQFKINRMNCELIFASSNYCKLQPYL